VEKTIFCSVLLLFFFNNLELERKINYFYFYFLFFGWNFLALGWQNNRGCKLSKGFFEGNFLKKSLITIFQGKKVKVELFIFRP